MTDKRIIGIGRGDGLKTAKEGDEKATTLPHLGALINTTIYLCSVIDHGASAFSNGSVLRSVRYVG